jgi:hypothetical protein
VPILDREFYCSWKNEMLGIFRTYNLSKYISTPYVPPIDPLHPTINEELGMLYNLRTMNLIIRGLANRLLRDMTNLECAYTMWKYLKDLHPDYSLRSLDEILHKTIALNKLCTDDLNFDKCFFELRDLMRKKG